MSALSDRIVATYRIETRYPLAEAAAALAGEQSSGTFRPIAGETPDLQARYGARVESIEDLGTVAAPSLPHARGPKARHPAAAPGPGPVGVEAGDLPRVGEVRVSWNLENTGTNLSAVWATVLGNLFELHHFSGLKLLDLALPPAFSHAYPGPRHGVTGTRALTGVPGGADGRPVLGTIVKPSVGLSPDETAALVDQLLAAGLDFVKDDELMADPPHSPFAERFEKVMRVIDRHADRTGRKAMYAVNISGDLDGMLRQLETVERRGGTCVMLVLNAVGLAGVTAVRRQTTGVAIHGHRAGWGLYDRSPALGMSYPAFQTFWRLAGVDHLHVNGLGNKFCEPDDSVIASARACLTPLIPPPGRPDIVMPVFSSAQTAVQAEETYRRLGSNDLIFCCGGGIMAHPGGPAAGVRSLVEAWDAAKAGIPARTYAATHPDLAAALDAFS
ncbi:RuBisCO large subunit C-terminal-like domain-containing protein [Mongoliimonas terrestris]|uniref:RuBisCO large subunit C-terminal-like domain-containing protein n=1 Tax=Mongoliimonas terrestris TaxID=1709001 RepID=UPI0009495564|nr:RuBisCO large subunit C-terminal-like domain-containing protein [Mongoliimonas terrestris]